MACAVVGGPLFALAGQLARTAQPRRRGLGVAVLAAMFVAEGTFTYIHEQRLYGAGATFVLIGLTVALVAARGRIAQLRWLALTIPLGLTGELALATVLRRYG